MVARHLVVLLGLVSWVAGYKDYSDRIPNGVRVPHPCKDNYLWHGVGHLNSQGGGSRNVFGVAFQKAGHVWTRELCQADSDGDGKTNGEELGEPRCVWTPGTTPERTVGITHPGVCEPMESEQCQTKPVPATPGEVYISQRDWIADACKSDQFVCEHLNTTADVRKMELSIPLTPVPAKETTYMCSFFDFENDTADFHIIATTPIINNSYVMHHMLLFGCRGDGGRGKQPFPCNMGGCSDIIGAWTLGLSGQCFHPKAGFKVGANGYKTLLIQYHWNNPLLRSDFVDSSGLTLYYTPNLRPHNLGMLMTGQNYLEIPPFTDLTIATSDCTATCTKQLLHGDIHITEAVNHMHYLGKSMYLEHHRAGQMLTYLAKTPPTTTTTQRSTCSRSRW
ncbi:DBH-like monooxygenase protein 1 homolog [Pomacea canaliculata]|uniref:DBH-like monooxygenase protein 1 homolog n=1 Tax=Pomacea canaliculata TaxID=400727 RepID=UPI000D73DA40|nr:DBH-like monooxygenase protein 1 homolog [Pomacea canaliculata]